ncbi:hypothetical protein ONZ45_g17352 [Pleurotus djamor]|nr:hypothetical protein ONZ45_g17352 [Pleurotus djamor]
MSHSSSSSASAVAITTLSNPASSARSSSTVEIDELESDVQESSIPPARKRQRLKLQRSAKPSPRRSLPKPANRRLASKLKGRRLISEDKSKRAGPSGKAEVAIKNLREEKEQSGIIPLSPSPSPSLQYDIAHIGGEALRETLVQLDMAEAALSGPSQAEKSQITFIDNEPGSGKAVRPLDDPTNTEGPCPGTQHLGRAFGVFLACLRSNNVDLNTVDLNNVDLNSLFPNSTTSPSAAASNQLGQTTPAPQLAAQEQSSVALIGPSSVVASTQVDQTTQDPQVVSRQPASMVLWWPDENELACHVKASVILKRSDIKKRLLLRIKHADLFFPNNVLPWRGLPFSLYHNGYQMLNIPDEVPFPGFESSQSSCRGISGFTYALCTPWVRVLPNDVSLGVIFRKVQPADLHLLKTGQIPVLISASPHPSSPHTRARQLYISGQRMWQDRNGPAKESVAQHLYGDYMAPSRTDVTIDTLLSSEREGLRGVSHSMSRPPKIDALLRRAANDGVESDEEEGKESEEEGDGSETEDASVDAATSRSHRRTSGSRRRRRRPTVESDEDEGRAPPLRSHGASSSSRRQQSGQSVESDDGEMPASPPRSHRTSSSSRHQRLGRSIGSDDGTNPSPSRSPRSTFGSRRESHRRANGPWAPSRLAKVHDGKETRRVLRSHHRRSHDENAPPPAKSQKSHRH